MSAKAAMKAADLNRLLKAAKAHGLVLVLPDGTRFVPPGLTDSVDDAPTSDPLDAELAEWAAKHGYG